MSEPDGRDGGDEDVDRGGGLGGLIVALLILFATMVTAFAVSYCRLNGN